MALDESKHVHVIRIDRKRFGAVQGKQNGPKCSISPMLVKTWTCTPHLYRRDADRRLEPFARTKTIQK